MYDSESRPRTRWSRSRRRLSIAVVAGMLLALSGLLGMRLADLRRPNAYVNGILVPVRATATGEFTARDGDLNPGDYVEADEPLGTVTDIDLPSLEREVQATREAVRALRDEVEAIEARLGRERQRLGRARRTLEDRQQTARSRIDHRIGLLAGELAEARQALTLAREAYRHTNALVWAGELTREQLERAEALVQRASDAVDEKQARLESARAEQEAASRGAPLGDDGGVSMASARLESIRSEVGVLASRLEQSRKELAAREEQLAQQVERLHERRLIEVVSPVRGVVWSRGVSDGQVVRAGERVVRVLDLDSVWVEARVAERVAAGLAVGSAATVSLRMGGVDHLLSGQVTAIRAGGDHEPAELVAAHPPQGVDVGEGVAVRVEVTFPDPALLRRGLRPGQFSGAGRTARVHFDAPAAGEEALSAR